jgi:hypothetical protein
VQVPARHASLAVQALPSLHGAPSLCGWLRQASFVSLQTPTVQSSPEELQSRGAPAHAPAWHASLTVQNAPSSHGVPFARGELEQRPVAGSQVPPSRHWSAEHWTLSPPMQAPPAHVSFFVQASPSSQGEPSALGALEHSPVSGTQAAS